MPYSSIYQCERFLIYHIEPHEGREELHINLGHFIAGLDMYAVVLSPHRFETIQRLEDDFAVPVIILLPPSKACFVDPRFKVRHHPGIDFINGVFLL